MDNAIVIIGAGLAGLSAALECAPEPVILISPTKLGTECSSAWAQGGIAAALGDNDSPATHAADTIVAGVGINNAHIVRQVTEDSAKVIERLVNAGVAFDRNEAGKLRLDLEAAHSFKRIVHAVDATGAAIIQALIRQVKATSSITVLERYSASELLIEDGAICGVVLDHEGKKNRITTSRIILATGSSCALWHETTVPHLNWGSGIALAARAGALLGDLEFVQFHPTAIDVGSDPMPLASEAIRGEGATLILEDGSRFTDELKPRDIVTRAIWEQITNGKKVFLDARFMDSKFLTRFPTVSAQCTAAGINPLIQPIPVKPAAHYHMGGVVTDARGRTSIAGLWACGEVACTGLHGANRLASNSLLEAESFGRKAAQDAQQYHKLIRTPPRSSAPSQSPSIDTEQLRLLMTSQVGIIRNKQGLTCAINWLAPQAHLSNMALVALLIAISAHQRTESRGSHYRSDFPQTEPQGSSSRLSLADIKEYYDITP